MYLLENNVQPYPWGSLTAVPDLPGRRPAGAPEAEEWLGAHPSSSSIIVGMDGMRVPLNDFIAANPEATLGPHSVRHFGPKLPYLMKVFAARSPLSLQVHPNAAQAKRGYAAEKAAGLKFSERNYTDDNHKPEIMFALTNFEALCGFRPPKESAAIFGKLAKNLPPGQLADLAAAVATHLHTAGTAAEASAGAGETGALRAALARLYLDPELSGRTAAATARLRKVSDLALDGEIRTVTELSQASPGDPGALVALLLNRVSLQPGEALYLPAGHIHAYLRGAGIEVMAASDNVLRGGLMSKRVDVPELLRTVSFESLKVPTLGAELRGHQRLYRPPFAEFQLQHIELGCCRLHTAARPEMVPLAQNGATIMLVTAGSILLKSPRTTLTLERGQSAFIPADNQQCLVRTVGRSPASAFAVTAGEHRRNPRSVHSICTIPASRPVEAAP